MGKNKIFQNTIIFEAQIFLFPDYFTSGMYQFSLLNSKQPAVGKQLFSVHVGSACQTPHGDRLIAKLDVMTSACL